MTRLDGKVALVTGASTGIGRAIARAFAKEGASLAIVSRTRSQLDKVVDEIGAAGGKALAVVADVTDRSAVEAGIEKANVSLGPISLLVNNAGLAGPYGPVGVVDPDVWWQSQAIHVYGTLLFMSAIIPGMRERKSGCIVNIASAGGLIVAPNLSSYCVAKATAIRLTEHVDAETKPDGVRAFVVQPGTIVTDMARDSINDPQAKKWVPFLVDDLSAIIDKDPTADLERLGKQVVALASGKYDGLAGAYLDLEQDLDELVQK